MIRATLHGKLPGELLAKEDALTATVFERLAYLEPERAWRILLAALRPIGTAPTPAATFQPSLWPWFTLEDGRRVQPDVLLPTGDRLLVIEAKRPEAGESQHEAQWGRELRAVRLRHAGPLMLVVLAPPPTPSPVSAGSSKISLASPAPRWGGRTSPPARNPTATSPPTGIATMPTPR